MKKQRTNQLSQTYRGRYYWQSSLVEKVADRISDFFGSFLFLLINLAWFVIWLIINLGLIPSIEPFDPYPFGLLTLIVSLEAIVLTIVVLISQNREANINDLRSEIDANIDTIAETEISKILAILKQIAQKNGIDLSEDQEFEKMLKPIDKNRMESEFAKEVKDS